MIDEAVLDACKAELKQDKTLNEMFETLDTYYDLDKPIGVMAKSNFIQSLHRLLKMTATKPHE